jgi:hypothetical protein
MLEALRCLGKRQEKSMIPGQAQKELFHNEALQTLDLVAAAAVDGVLVDAPPASPATGDCYVVGANPSGPWVGHALALAGYTDGGWRFVGPIDGMRVLDKANHSIATFVDGSWESGPLLGAALAAVVDPVGGATVDAEARSAITAILARLRAHRLIEA